MAAVIKGRAVVWSIGALTYTAGITDLTSFHQSVKFARTSEKAEIKDNGGVIRTQVFHGFKKTLSLTIVPVALTGTNTIANARTQMDTHTLGPGTTVTIADDSGTLIDGSFNVISATQNRTVDGVATVDVELEQGDESNDLTTAVS